MKKSTLFSILLPVIMMMVGITVKAQTISALADLNAATKAVYCSTDHVKLTAASTGSTSYTWQRYQGIGVSGSPTTVSGTTANMDDASITAPGYYTYVSTGSNTNCQSDVSDPITVYVLPNINATITGPATACVSAAGSTVLTAAASSATSVSEAFAYTYQWYKGSTLLTGQTGSTYTLNATTDAGVGAESFSVKAYYVIKPACTEGTSAPYTVTIEPNPTKPVVSITTP